MPAWPIPPSPPKRRNNGGKGSSPLPAVLCHRRLEPWWLSSRGASGAVYLISTDTIGQLTNATLMARVGAAWAEARSLTELNAALS